MMDTATSCKDASCAPLPNGSGVCHLVSLMGCLRLSHKATFSLSCPPLSLIPPPIPLSIPSIPHSGLPDLGSHPLLSRAHPTIEHLLPLHVAAGAGASDGQPATLAASSTTCASDSHNSDAVKLFDYHIWSLSNSAWAFGPGAQQLRGVGSGVCA